MYPDDFDFNRQLADASSALSGLMEYQREEAARERAAQDAIFEVSRQLAEVNRKLDESNRKAEDANIKADNQRAELEKLRKESGSGKTFAQIMTTISALAAAAGAVISLLAWLLR